MGINPPVPIAIYFAAENQGHTVLGIILEKLLKKIVDYPVKSSITFSMPRVSDMKVGLTGGALDLMWENSYGTTSVDGICERAGAKKGSFYYFFKSKSELTAAALEAEWNKNKTNMDALFSPTVPPLERFDRYFDYVHDHLAKLQEKCGSILGCPMLSIGSEVSTQDKAVRAIFERIWDRKIKYFEPAMRDAHAQGLIGAPDPEAMGG